MKNCLLGIIAFSLNIDIAVCQEHIEWNRYKELSRDENHTVYLDTINGDTLHEYFRWEERSLISKEGIEIFKGSLFGGMGTECGCVPKPNGYWIKRYRSGGLMEVGEYRCNRKIGTWTFYYENGGFRKIESYQTPYSKFLLDASLPDDTLKNPYLLNGSYSEYYPNGSIKTVGQYEIIEELRNTDTTLLFDPATYEDVLLIKHGRFWAPISVKSGLWKEFGEDGVLITATYIDPISDYDKFRPLEFRYYELLERYKRR